MIRIGQQFRSVGGPDAASPAIVSACFQRMCSWIEIAGETLKTEWPSFEATQAFSVFQLRPRLAAQVIKKDLSKICQVFGEQKDLPKLDSSFTDCEYTASKRSLLVKSKVIFACYEPSFPCFTHCVVLHLGERIADSEDLADLQAWISALRTTAQLNTHEVLSSVWQERYVWATHPLRLVKETLET